MSCGKGQPHLHLAGRTIYTGSIEGLARTYAPRYATGGYGQNTRYTSELAMNPLERLALPELTSGHTERVVEPSSMSTTTNEIHVHPREQYRPEPNEENDYVVFIKLHIGLPELPKHAHVHHLFNRPVKERIAPYPVEETDYSAKKAKQRELKTKLAAAKLQTTIRDEKVLEAA